MAALSTVSEIPELAQGKIPVELYLRCSDYEPDAEFVDGVIEERPTGEWDHSSWQQAVELWFLQHKREWNIRVRVELRVQISPTRYRVPDVTVVHTPTVVEQIVKSTPIAVFEVLSPKDQIPRVLAKLQDYHRMGILTIVVINTLTKTIYRYCNEGLEVITGTVMELPGSVCSIDWRRVEELLD